MRTLVIRLCLPLLFFAVLATAQQPDGTILTSHPRPALPAYSTLDAFGRSYVSRTLYNEARSETRFNAQQITYASDGLAVPALLITPKHRGPHKWPAILFNRGGNGALGSIMDAGGPCSGDNTACLDYVDLYLLAKAGYVVIASDYRYQGPTLKRDQWGGDEVDDVLNLVYTLRSLGYVDMHRLYMLGLSRGGAETYLALKRGAPVQAAAVIGAVTDVKAWVDSRPAMHLVTGNPYIDGFANIWPDYAHRADEEYRDRSAVFWADKLNVPILILHSRTDAMVPVSQALNMALALDQANKPFALHIYSEDANPLPHNREDRNRQILAWFQAHP